MSVKNIIFDLGAVMFDWNPKLISETFTSDVELQKRIQNELFFHQNWLDFDCGLVTEEDAIRIASEQLSVSLQESERLFELVKKSLVLLPQTEHVLKTVKNKNYNVYCLSNISPELFTYLSAKHSLFDLFDGIVTSGAEKTAKPGKRIFEILIERFELQPEECLFIDDSAANTKTATELGITSITFKGLDSCYEEIGRYIK